MRRSNERQNFLRKMNTWRLSAHPSQNRGKRRATFGLQFLSMNQRHRPGAPDEPFLLVWELTTDNRPPITRAS